MKGELFGVFWAWYLFAGARDGERMPGLYTFLLFLFH